MNNFWKSFFSELIFCHRCLRPILVSRNQLEADPNFPLDEIFKPSFRRGLFTIGLIFRNFDFKSPLVYGDGLGPG